MQVASLIIGIFAAIGLFFASVPLLGWLNWLNIPFAITGLVLGAIGVSTARRSRAAGVIGIVLCLLAIILGLIRLEWGCGII